MARLTTDSPYSNQELLMNLAYAKDDEAYLRLRPDEKLCDYVADCCVDHHCACMTPELVMEDGLMDCTPCPISLLYSLAIQAAELRTVLKLFEDSEEAGKLYADWISTADRMPPVAEPVLIARRAEYGRPLIVEQGILLPGGVWKTFGHKFKNIPFWMPLPAPPEEGEV